MTTIATIVVIFAATWVGFSAFSLWTRKAFVVDGLIAYDVPESWWPRLATAKVLGSLGLLLGLVIPAVGVAASVGLTLYFTGAVIIIIRARAYGHIPFPLLYLVPALAAGWLIAST